MKKLFVILVLALTACGAPEEKDPPYFAAQITDWQQRESIAPAIATVCRYTGSLSFDIQEQLKQIPHFRIILDEPDYWQTSQESLNLLAGDCEDAAILSYRLLSDSCLPEFYEIDIRIRIIKASEKSSHAVAIVYAGAKSYEIDTFVLRDEEDLPVLAEFDSEFIFF